MVSFDFIPAVQYIMYSIYIFHELSFFHFIQVLPLFVFFVPTGLGDRNLEVRKHMLTAALKAVNDHGKVTLLSIL